MLNKGRVCIKTAGREAGSVCVVIGKVDDVHVLIDGMVKRRNCNIRHLEPVPKTVKVSKSSSKKEVVDALIELKLVKSEDAKKFLNKKPKVPKDKPVKVKKVKDKKKVKKKKVVKKKTVKKEKAEKKVVKKKAVKKKAPAKKKPAKK